MSVIQSHYSLSTSHPAFTAAGRATYSVVARQAGVWIKLRIINIHSRVYTIQSQGKSDGSLVSLHLICSSTSRRWLISCYNLLTALLFVPCSVESVCQIPGPIKSAPFKTHVVLMVGLVATRWFPLKFKTLPADLYEVSAHSIWVAHRHRYQFYHHVVYSFMKITLLKKCAVPQSYPPWPNIWRVRFIFMFYVLGPSNQLFQVAYNVAARMGGIFM